MTSAAEPRQSRETFVKGVHGVRYQVKDVSRLEHQQLPAFASISLGGSQILLSGPGASGSRPMPNGQHQEPGGWNRVVLKVAGPGGRQIQIEDPDGNPIELFEAAR
jgi:glyoxylase I family protein